MRRVGPGGEKGDVGVAGVEDGAVREEGVEGVDGAVGVAYYGDVGNGEVGEEGGDDVCVCKGGADS